MNTYQKGNLSEAVITARFLEAGYNVLIPVGGGHRYDLVIETNEGFKKIQVKTSRIYEGRIIFNTCSNNKGYKRKTYHGDVDFFGVHCPALNECFLIPVEKTGKSEMRLSIEPVDSKRLDFKDDYLIKSIISI